MTIIFRILILLTFFFNTGCASLLFYPQKEHGKNPFLNKFSYEDVYFKSSDDLKLHGWFIKTSSKSKGTILFLHGNAENISTHINSVLWLIPEGYDVFAFDYRGYGRSEGSPELKGVHLDAEAALKKVFDLPGVDRERIFVFGQSIGGAIAVHTVATFPDKGRIKALIIESAFSGYRLIAREKLGDMIITWPLQYPLSYLFDDHYSAVRWIREITPVPVLIIHGNEDRIVPVHHGSMLYEKALDPKDFWRVKGVGHIQSLALKEIREKYLEYLQSFQ